jgi:tripartite-type tricarboxylate transporter receptor subunit TctC
MSCRKLLGAAALSLVAGIATAAPFPERELTGVIMWGAGGATDVVARAVTPPAEEALGKKIVLVNKSGGTGAISTNFVNNAPSDGYTLLYGAENPQLHQVLGIADFGYEKFYPVNVLGRGVAVIVVKNDAPWNSLKDFVEDAKKRPGKLKMGSTGPGGLPHTVGSMLNSITKFQVISVPFDGEGPGLTALLGGHVDMMPVGSGAAAENIKAGRVKALAVVDNEALPMQGSPNIAPITKDYPEFAKYLPWGPFYGVFVKRDTPDDVKAALVKAFKAAAANPQFVTLMKDRGNVMMNVSGAEADAFLKKWQSVTSWVLQDVGAAKASPEKFGIPKP